MLKRRMTLFRVFVLSDFYLGSDKQFLNLLLCSNFATATLTVVITSCVWTCFYKFLGLFFRFICLFL